MNAHKNILNPQALLSLYGKFPSLSGSEITELLLRRDESRVSIKIMTSNKPKSVPARWSENYDVIFLGISFIGAKEVVASGWGVTNIASTFDVENLGDRASVRISDEKEFSISFDCDWISIESVVPGIIGKP